MLYEEKREKLLGILEDLKAYNLIGPAGGALSLRCSEEHILLTATGAHFRRWRLAKEDFIVLDLAGNVVETHGQFGPAGTPLYLAIYSLFPKCNAVIHSHAGYSLAFAALGISIPSSCYALETLGEVPCLYGNEAAIKRQFKAAPAPIDMPPGMTQRPEVAAVFRHVVDQFKEQMLPRKEELSEHGLAFTLHKHGIFVFARSIDEAFENLARVEESARASVVGSLIRAGSDAIPSTLASTSTSS